MMSDENYIGIVFSKSGYDSELYMATAEWCNETQRARIVEREDCYECIAVPEPTFAQKKAEKLLGLKASFDERVSGSFVCLLGWPMQFDRSDILAVEGAIQLMHATEKSTSYLTDANDVTHYDLALSVITDIKLEMLAAYAQCHARKQELRKQINDAQSKGELAAIEITWPV